ncbi:GNAT family protein [Catenulispora subtropica]|uniref:GNAT family protein n=1 Tax=Catenulispora subtropica TaxID=450798 RepID=A0ABN2TFS9_9ACTN
MTLSFAAKPTLRGDRVTLRPVTVADVPDLIAMLADPEGKRLTATRATFTREQLEHWYGTRGEQTDRVDLAIVENTTGRYVGEVVLNELDADNRSCGFRITLMGPRVFGRGYGTEATRLVLSHAFDTVGVHRVELDVYAFNPRARHVYEKVGFVLEGTKRDALLWDGEWIDCHVMAMLRKDWRSTR